MIIATLLVIKMKESTLNPKKKNIQLRLVNSKNMRTQFEKKAKKKRKDMNEFRFHPLINIDMKSKKRDHLFLQSLLFKSQPTELKTPIPKIISKLLKIIEDMSLHISLNNRRSSRILFIFIKIKLLPKIIF